MSTVARVAQLWRHPIKSLGAERVARAELAPGATMPFDRTWAIAHEKSRADAEAPGWLPPSAWLRCAVAPLFAAVSASVDEATGRVTLSHPRRPALTFHPDDAADRPRFLDWVGALLPEGLPRPSGLVRVPGRGMTDSDFPSVSVASLASLRALAARMGTRLDPRRFRANIWLDGLAPDSLAPWEENAWPGREIAIGAARLRVVERITRCNATKANPETGLRDAETLAALEAHLGQPEFAVYCEVLAGGPVAEGDRAVAA